MFSVAILNPISGATIREYEFSSIDELNNFLSYVAEIGLYAFRIAGCKRAFMKRAAA